MPEFGAKYIPGRDFPDPNAFANPTEWFEACSKEEMGKAFVRLMAEYSALKQAKESLEAVAQILAVEAIKLATPARPPTSADDVRIVH